MYKEIPPRYSDKLRRLVSEMLNRNVDQRPSMKQILLNSYVQERIEKLEKERKGKEQAMEGQVKNYRKIMSYNRKLYSNKASQNQSRNYSRESKKREKNFTKNKQPKIFIINNAKKPPKRSVQPQVVGSALANLRERTPKIEFARKKSKPRNMLDELMGGKKISQILREDDDKKKPDKPASPKVAVKLANEGRMGQMRNALYKKKSRDRRETKGRKAEARVKKPVVRRKSCKEPQARPAARKPKLARGSMAYRKHKAQEQRAGAKSKSTGKRKNFGKKRRSENFKFILDNQKPNKKKFINQLEREYKKRIQSFQNLDDKFRNLEQRARTPKAGQEVVIDQFLAKEDTMKSFHMDLVRDMDDLISKNDEISLELRKRPSNSSAITVRQKEPQLGGEKRRKIKKDFGQWFSEDYFENCLKVEGEFCGQDGARQAGEPQDEHIEQGRERQIHNIRRDFAKKNVVEEVHDVSESKRVLSLNVSSNEKLPLTFSNGYTISNKRNKFGHQLKRLLEQGSRHRRHNASERNEFRHRSRIDFDENSSSVRLTMFFNRLRSALSRMKQRAEYQEHYLNRRTRSCGITRHSEPSAPKSESQRLRSVYLTKRLGRNSSCIKDWKNGQDGLEQSNGRNRALTAEHGPIDLEIYLKYHNNVLRVMQSFLLQKWNEELEALNSRTNPRQMIQKQQAAKKRPKIFQAVENRRPKMEQKYVVRKQKKPRVSKKRALMRVNLRKSSGEMGTHVIQEPKKQKPVQSETGKTSKPQVLKVYPQNTGHSRREDSPGEESEDKAREMWIEQKRPTSGLLQQTCSDIKEEKSIKPVVHMNTREELVMLERIHQEQNQLAEREMQSMLRGRNCTLINDFTQIKDPFKAQNVLKHSDTHDKEPYDLQIENVIMSEEELSILEGNDREDSLDKYTKPQKGVLGGLLDIDTQAGDRHSFQPIMKLLGIRKPKYMHGVEGNAPVGQTGNAMGEPEQAEAGMLEDSQSVLRDTIDAEIEISRNSLDQPIRIRDKSKGQSSQVRQYSLDQPTRVDLSLARRSSRERKEEIPFRGILDRSRSTSLRKNAARNEPIKIMNLEDLAPDVSVKKIARRIRSIEHKKFDKKMLLEYNKFHNLPESQLKGAGPRKKKKKRMTKKKNYLARNKKNLPHQKKIYYKKFMNGKMDKQLMDFEDAERKPLLRDDSIDRLSREDRWSRKRDKRKIKRADSKHQFYVDIRRSIDKLSHQRDSIDRSRELRRSRARLHAGRDGWLEAGEGSLERQIAGRHSKQYSDKRARSKNFLNRKRSSAAKHDSLEKAKLNQTHDVFVDAGRQQKPSFNTGKLSSFLANFNIAENIEASMAADERDLRMSQPVSKIGRLSTQPVYRPSLGNKKLNYLTSNAKKPPMKEKHHFKSNLWETKNPRPKVKTAYRGSTHESQDKFLQSGIPPNVSQSNSEHYRNSLSKGAGRGAYDFERMDSGELDNLRNNFNSYSDRYASNKAQDPWNPTIDVSMNSRENLSKRKPPSNVKMNLLRNRKKKLIKRLSVKVDKGLIHGFLGEIFEKFRKVERVGPDDVEKLNRKYFRHFDSKQKRLMPSIYQLIDVEIAIQSSELKQMT